MFIQTEQTPNPETLKFIPGKEVLASGTAEFKDAQSAARSPLGVRLFTVEGVVGVFLGADFIAVTKGAEKEWQILKPSILGAIMEHYASGEPLLREASQGEGENEERSAESPIEAQIRELIDTRVRPAVAQDGGDIVFESYEDGIVYLQMRGACSGCPSSTMTLKAGIENMLKHYIPEIQEVRAVA